MAFDSMQQNSPPAGLSGIRRTRMSLLEKCDLIDATQWANELSFAQVEHLAAYMDVYHVPADKVLFQEGDKNAFLVLIVKGAVKAVKYDSEHTPKCIATLGPGRTIGEMSIIDGEPRSATAVTASDATLLLINAEKFDRLMTERPHTGAALVLKIAKLMSQYLRQTSGRLIDHLVG
jgi:CRP/FNR family transcriptional regulator, cyclic AMP receptor protein